MEVGNNCSLVLSFFLVCPSHLSLLKEAIYLEHKRRKNINPPFVISNSMLPKYSDLSDLEFGVHSNMP